MRVIDDLIECRFFSVHFESEQSRIEIKFVSPWDGSFSLLKVEGVYQFQMSEVCLENIVDQLLVFNAIEAEVSNVDYLNSLRGCLSLAQLSDNVLLKNSISVIKSQSLMLLHLTSVIGASVTCLARGYSLESMAQMDDQSMI